MSGCGAACPQPRSWVAAPCTKKVQPCFAAAQAGCWIDGTKLDGTAQKTAKMTNQQNPKFQELVAKLRQIEPEFLQRMFSVEDV